MLDCMRINLLRRSNCFVHLGASLHLLGFFCDVIDAWKLNDSLLLIHAGHDLLVVFIIVLDDAFACISIRVAPEVERVLGGIGVLKLSTARMLMYLAGIEQRVILQILRTFIRRYTSLGSWRLTVKALDTLNTLNASLGHASFEGLRLRAGGEVLERRHPSTEYTILSLMPFHAWQQVRR